MSTPTPIKRSAQLAPLSRDHHEGLLFSWKIEQGLKRGIDHQRIGAFVNWFWDHHLKEHFREEEEILAPLLPVGDPLVQQMISEHQSIEGLIHINQQIADPHLLEQIASQVHDHIRFEERQLFNHAEQILGTDGLNRLKFHDESGPGGPAYSDEFWLTPR